jgi:hypothetical protein
MEIKVLTTIKAYKMSDLLTEEGSVSSREECEFDTNERHVLINGEVAPDHLSKLILAYAEGRFTEWGFAPPAKL